MNKIRLALVTYFLMFTPNLVSACDSLELLGGWVKNPLPGTNYTAAYFSIKNNKEKSQNINNFSSADFANVMIHTSEKNNDLTKMKHLKSLQIPPNQIIKAEPGGIHLMLKVKPESTFKITQLVLFSAYCESGDIWQFSLPIKNPSSN